MAYRNKIDNQRLLIRMQWVLIGTISIVAVGLWQGWRSAPDKITVYYPPDLRSLQKQAIREIPPEQIYGFAYYIWQQINRWPTNGAKDYGENIWRLTAFLSERFQQDLIEDMERRAEGGELTYRTRWVAEIPGAGYTHQRVKVLGPDAWLVTLDLDVTEYVQGTQVKKTRLRYPLIVRRAVIDPERNPWSLVLDGYADPGPQRIDDMG